MKKYNEKSKFQGSEFFPKPKKAIKIEYFQDIDTVCPPTYHLWNKFYSNSTYGYGYTNLIIYGVPIVPKYLNEKRKIPHEKT